MDEHELPPLPVVAWMTDSVYRSDAFIPAEFKNNAPDAFNDYSHALVRRSDALAAVAAASAGSAEKAKPVAWWYSDGQVRVRVDRKPAVTTALYAEPPPSPSQEVLPCGHPAPMMLMSAETGKPLYCEACDDKSGRRDAEQMEVALRARLERAEQALREIAGQDPIELILDPQWAKRIAGAALAIEKE